MRCFHYLIASLFIFKCYYAVGHTGDHTINGAFDHANYSDVEDLRFGIDDKTDSAWFEFHSKEVGNISHSGLVLQKELFAKIGNLQTKSHESRTYQKPNSHGGVSMTVHSKHLVSIFILHQNQVLEVIPKHLLEEDVRGKYGHKSSHLLRLLESYMPWGGDRECGAFVTIENVTQGASNEPVQMGKVTPYHLRKKDSTEKLYMYQERLMKQAKHKNDAQGKNNRRLKAKSWVGCYAGQETPRILEVGLVIDLGYHKGYGSNLDTTMDSVEVVLANTNLIYFLQLNIFIRARQVIVVTEPITGESCIPKETPLFEEILEQDPTTGNCCHGIDRENLYCLFNVDVLDIETSLDTMVAFSETATVSNDPESMNVPIPQTYSEIKDQSSPIMYLAHWHYLTGCYGSAQCQGTGNCIIGLAYSNKNFPQNTLCSPAGTNVAVSSRQQQTWLIFAHELGHNFGAYHSFEEGQGTTGGIMDYGDGKYLGEYQFNEEYRREEICSELDYIFQTGQCIVNDIDLFPSYETETCIGQEDNAPCELGACRDQICLPLETQVRVVTENTDYAFRVEVSEFGPMSPYEQPIVAPFTIAQTVGCTVDSSNPFPETHENTIVLVQTSECESNEVAANAQERGALAVVFINSGDGPAEPMAGPGHFIPTVMISRIDGQVLTSVIIGENNYTGFLGGLPASDTPLFSDITDFWQNYQIIYITLGAVPLLFMLHYTKQFRKSCTQKQRRKKVANLRMQFMADKADTRPADFVPPWSGSSRQRREHTPEEEDAIGAAESFAGWLRHSRNGE